MGYKTTGIHWTNLELKGLLEDEDSCVHLERIQKHLGLRPIHLTNLNEALREILNNNLNSYDPELNGLLLSYKNPKILSHYGDILYDTCFIHIDIEADFYIFRPEVGRCLKGFVNKKGTNHIGILVHKAFNVSVPKPDDIENQEDWPGNKVQLGQEVKFTLDEVDYKSRLPYIRGLIYEENYLNGCRLFNEQIAATYDSEFYKITRWNSIGKSTDIKNVEPKKENKRIIFNYDSDIDIDEISESEEKPKKLKIKLNGSQESIINSPKKKKKKSLHKSESELETDNDEKCKIKIKKINKSTNSLSESFDSSCTDKENSKMSLKKSKKHKKYIEHNSTDDEKEHKSRFIKSSIPNFELANEIPIKSESDTLKTPKKRKRSSLENDNLNNAENDKQILKNSLKEATVQNDKSEIELIQSPPKKKKKKHETSETMLFIDTEDERRYKKSVIKDLLDNFKVDQSNEVEPELKKKSKKHKQSIINDEKFMDTEDEKQYKSTLKSLIKTIENDSEFKEPKQTKVKKKRKSSKSELDVEFDPEIEVKIEEESQSEAVDDTDCNESDHVLKKKRKKSHKSQKIKIEKTE